MGNPTIHAIKYKRHKNSQSSDFDSNLTGTRGLKDVQNYLDNKQPTKKILLSNLFENSFLQNVLGKHVDARLSVN